LKRHKKNRKPSFLGGVSKKRRKPMNEGQTLSIELLDSYPCDEIFARGTFMDSLDDIPLCCPISNKLVHWVAVKGMRHKLNGHSDWCIYASNPHYTFEDLVQIKAFHILQGLEPDDFELHWTDTMVKNIGDKISLEKNIKKLVPCTERAYERYRR
jgi:hypothetical protein